MGHGHFFPCIFFFFVEYSRLETVILKLYVCPGFCTDNLSNDVWSRWWFKQDVEKREVWNHGQFADTFWGYCIFFVGLINNHNLTILFFVSFGFLFWLKIKLFSVVVSSVLSWHCPCPVLCDLNLCKQM